MRRALLSLAALAALGLAFSGPVSAATAGSPAPDGTTNVKMVHRSARSPMRVAHRNGRSHRHGRAYHRGGRVRYRHGHGHWGRSRTIRWHRYSATRGL